MEPEPCAIGQEVRAEVCLAGQWVIRVGIHAPQIQMRILQDAAHQAHYVCMIRVYAVNSPNRPSLGPTACKAKKYEQCNRNKNPLYKLHFQFPQTAPKLNLVHSSDRKVLPLKARGIFACRRCAL